MRHDPNGHARPAPPHAAAPAADRPRAGVVAAVLTPCRAPAVPDPEAMRRLCGRLTGEGGCDGLFVVGSTGELPLLDEDERRTLIAAAREGAAQQTVIYAGVSGTGVKQSLRYAKQAAAAGADVAVMMAPFFLKLTQAELYDHVLRFVDASPIPAAVYHHLRMPTPFAVDTVARLAEHPNMVAMKDTSGDLERMRELVAATRGTGLSLFQGSEFLLHPSMEAGAAGCVTALAGVAPHWHRELMDAIRRGDRAAGAAAQERITALAGMFRFEQMALSFAHFAFMLRCAARAQGLVENTHGMVGGFEPPPGFEAQVLAHLREVGLVSEEASAGRA